MRHNQCRLDVHTAAKRAGNSLKGMPVLAPESCTGGTATLSDKHCSAAPPLVNEPERRGHHPHTSLRDGLAPRARESYSRNLAPSSLLNRLTILECTFATCLSVKVRSSCLYVSE